MKFSRAARTLFVHNFPLNVSSFSCFTFRVLLLFFSSVPFVWGDHLFCLFLYVPGNERRSWWWEFTRASCIDWLSPSLFSESHPLEMRNKRFLLVFYWSGTGNEILIFPGLGALFMALGIFFLKYCCSPVEENLRQTSNFDTLFVFTVWFLPRVFCHKPTLDVTIAAQRATKKGNDFLLWWVTVES